jgi:WD40 repeat protein
MNRVKQNENTKHGTFLAGIFARVFRRIQPADITEAEFPEEQAAGKESQGKTEELEPVIIDLVSGKRLRRRSLPMYVRVVRLVAVILTLALLVTGLFLLPLLQKKPSPRVNLRVIFSTAHLSNLSLPAWADDSIEEEVYSGFGPPAYYGVVCPQQFADQTVCGDQHLSFVDNQGNLYTWKKSSGQLAREITLQPASRGDLSLSWSWLYEGKYILSHEKMADGRDLYKIWDVIHDRLLFTGATPLLSLSSDGKWIAVYSSQRTIQIFDGLHGKGIVYTFSSPYLAHLVALSWSPDTSRLATASADGGIQTWNAFTGALLSRWSDLRPVEPPARHVDKVALAWAPYGLRLAAASVAGGANLPIHIWDASTGQLLLSYTGHSSQPANMTWLDGGQEMLSSSAHESLLWSTSSGKTLLRVNLQRISAPPQYYTSPILSAEPLLAVPLGSSMQVLDGRTGKLLQTLSNEDGDSTFVAIAWNPEENTYPAAVDKNGNLLIWDTQSWQVISHYQLPCALSDQRLASPVDLAWSPDGRMLAVNCGRGGLIILNITEQ